MRLDDLLAPGFVIVTATRESMNGLSPAALKIWQELNGQRAIVGTRVMDAAPDDVVVVTETGRLFADWLRDNAIEAVIVRPDRYVFAGAQTAAELNAFIGTLAGLLKT
jgi:hypothetical protein